MVHFAQWVNGLTYVEIFFISILGVFGLTAIGKVVAEALDDMHLMPIIFVLLLGILIFVGFDLYGAS